MTKKEWLTCPYGHALAEFWGDRFTERKARLLMLACCRRHAFARTNATLRAAVEAVTAHFADPGAADKPFESKQLRDLYKRVNRIASGRQREPERGIAFGVLAAVEPNSVGEELGESISFLVYSCLYDIADGLSDAEIEGEGAAQAVLVREVLGNPLLRTKPKVKPAWRTDTVMTLARQMYTAEEFGAMPILADALQDAGCDNNDILNHCRDTSQPHVRGCWVLDLLFDKK
jgi:hypothetical protein